MEPLPVSGDHQSRDPMLLTPAQREELDRRLDELEREGPVGVTWDELLNRIQSKM